MTGLTWRDSDLALLARPATQVVGRARRRYRGRLTRRILPDRHGYIICHKIRGIVTVYYTGPTRNGNGSFTHRRADVYVYRNIEAATAAICGCGLPPECQILRVRL